MRTPPSGEKGRFVGARLLAVVVLVAVAGCAGLDQARLGDQMANEGKWESAVFFYDDAVKRAPKHAEFQKKLAKAKTEAAKTHAATGKEYLAARQIGLALEEFRRALVLDPGQSEHQDAMSRTLRLKEAQDAFETGRRLMKASRREEALAAFERALERDPAHVPAQEAIAELTKPPVGVAPIPALTSPAPISLKFQDTKLKEVFEMLGRISGLIFLLEKDVRPDEAVTVQIKEKPLREALRLILQTHRLFLKRLNADTFLVVPLTRQKQEQYEDLLIRTFYLSNSRAQEMVNLLRTMLETRRVYINQELNALVIRDTADRLRLAEKIIEANDRGVPEVMLDVEVLEVNRTKSLKYGWNFTPSGRVTGRIAVPGPNAPEVSASALRTLGDASFLFTLPGVVVDLMKQESDAQTLANPKVRVQNMKAARVNLGDRVPILVTTTTQNPTTPTGPGGVTIVNSIEYKDVGIKVGVEPVIHLDNTVTFKLNLEVTSLGDLVDLGGGVRQFRFGTRNADTVLTIRDGETVIIGGLLRDEERVSLNKIPGLGDLPILGKFFSGTETGKVKTDLLLTMTPHVVKGLEPPASAFQSFFSGTEETFSTAPLYEEGAIGLEPLPPPPAPSPPKEGPKDIPKDIR